MTHRSIPIAALGLISGIHLGLAGCASTKDTVLPQDGPTMTAIYEQHWQATGTEDAQAARAALGHRPLQSNDTDLRGYTRTAFTELEQRFPRVPNPTLLLYVFPHLAGDSGVPVPGYTTAFPMYERIEYALPGEVPGRPAGNDNP